MHGWMDLGELLLLVAAGVVVVIGIFAHTIWKERQMAKLRHHHRHLPGLRRTRDGRQVELRLGPAMTRGCPP